MKIDNQESELTKQKENEYENLDLNSDLDYS